jgi:hypothetical protein
MSTTTVPIASIASLALIGLYHAREFYLPLKDQHAKDKERIQALEEEIVRLKREMRICGITVPYASSSTPFTPSPLHPSIQKS